MLPVDDILEKVEGELDHKNHWLYSYLLALPPFIRPHLDILGYSSYLKILDHISKFLVPDKESESEVMQSCPTLSDSMDCSPPGMAIYLINLVIYLIIIITNNYSSQPLLSFYYVTGIKIRS